MEHGRAAKESLFLWNVMHGILESNNGKENQRVGITCPGCKNGEEESTMHLLFLYKYAQPIWRWGGRLFASLQPPTSPTFQPTWIHSLLGEKFPNYLQHLQKL